MGENYKSKIEIYLMIYIVVMYVLYVLLQISELEAAKLFVHEKNLVTIVRECLQVNAADRPLARDALKQLELYKNQSSENMLIFI